MAAALVSYVLKELYAIAKDEVSLLIGVTNEVKKLSSTFTAIQAVFEDAETQQVQKKEVQDWLEKLKDVAYEAEDVLDEWRTDAFISQRDKDDNHVGKKVRPSLRFCLLFPCFCFNQVELRHETGGRIREIRERLDQISTEKNAFSFNEVNARPRTEERQTGSIIIESEIFGRDHDKESLVSKLICETSGEEKSCSVLSIVGMGGLAKTTLAQLVYNDDSVMAHFQKRIWVCVSDDFDEKRIATKVIESMGGSTDGNHDFETLQRRLLEVVGKMTFLLVLDDVWNENNEHLQTLSLHGGGMSKNEWRTIGDDEIRKMEGVIEGLGRPHTNLKQLHGGGMSKNEWRTIGDDEIMGTSKAFNNPFHLPNFIISYCSPLIL